jgi:peptidyl-prolyl cis-trans isomerase B (cyclophilin B)
VASSRDRQRKLARAKLDRQMARRAGKVRRRRRILAGTGAALAIVLIVGGIAWFGGAFDSNGKSSDPADSALCSWTPQSATTNTSLKEVGTPPTSGFPTSGTEQMTVDTNVGDPISVTLDVGDAPCSAESLSFLAGKKFFDNTNCTEITAEGALHCGDPGGTGLGGPTYSIYDENVPTVAEASASPAPSASAGAGSSAPTYPKGTVALIGNPPGTNGSQFLIFLKDFTTKTPTYPVIGVVTVGTDTLGKIAQIPTVDNGSGLKVKPKSTITIKTLTVGTAADSATTAPSAGPSASSQS